MEVFDVPHMGSSEVIHGPMSLNSVRIYNIYYLLVWAKADAIRPTKLISRNTNRVAYRTWHGNLGLAETFAQIHRRHQ